MTAWLRRWWSGSDLTRLDALRLLLARPEETDDEQKDNDQAESPAWLWRLLGFARRA